MVPALALPPTTPPADQVTAVLLSPVTVAVNCLVSPTTTDSLLGVTVMVCARSAGPARAAASRRKHVFRCILSEILLFLELLGWRRRALRQVPFFSFHKNRRKPAARIAAGNP